MQVVCPGDILDACAVSHGDGRQGLAGSDPVIHEGGPWGGYDGYFIEIGKQQILVAGRDF